MGPYRDLGIERSDHGVVTVTFDMAGRSVNLFTEELVRDLSTIVTALEHDSSVALVLFRSAKQSGFLAGADLNWVRQLKDAGDVQHMLGQGQRLCSRIEALPMPTVAVIHGYCYGGGLEFALSCTHRLACPEPSTRLGLPETNLGLIPAWGGTQRLPRLVGQAIGLRMIQEGRSLTAAQSTWIGLVDAVFPPTTFDRDVAEFAEQRRSPGSTQPRTPPSWLAQWWAGVRLELSSPQKFGRWLLRRHTKDEPARLAARRVVEVGLTHGLERGLAAERDEFIQLLFNPVCRAQLDQFFERRHRPTESSDGQRGA